MTSEAPIASGAIMASPKSRILTCPSCVTSTLDGFVAMDDARCVRGSQAVRDLDGEVQQAPDVVRWLNRRAFTRSITMYDGPTS